MGLVVGMGWWQDTQRRTTHQLQAAREAEARKREREARRLAPGPNLIAHCQEFWPITALPWQCPVCQAVLLEETTG